MTLSTNNQAFLVAGVRTPFGRYGGALSGVRTDDLAAHVLRGLAGRLPSVDWDELDDVVLGCANQASEDNRNVARMAALLDGLPVTAPGGTVNRLCGSSLDAIAIASRAVRSGDADLVLAGGVESMSRAPFVIPKATSAFSRSTEIHDSTIGWRLVNPEMRERFGTDSMPETRTGGRRIRHRPGRPGRVRAALAGPGGQGHRLWPVGPRDPAGDHPAAAGRAVGRLTDEHPRATSAEALAKLKPINPGGTVTAGTASGVNDGAAAVLIASEKAVKAYGLTPLARVTSAAAAGVPPRIMGIGPVPATQKLLSRTGLTVSDMDVVELNEAFAAQALAVLRQLGLEDDAEHVNPNGGAIALGHPLGASGARIALSAAIELHDRGARRALATMCIGVGQGISVLLEAA